MKNSAKGLVSKLALATGLALGAATVQDARAQLVIFQDDFSSGRLDAARWEVRQDVEGQPFTDEYDVRNENGNWVFHTQQNTVGDRRSYLVPKHQFITGDVLEYDYNVISKSGNYMSMSLLTGDQYIRIGISGYSSGVQGFDEFGVSHVKFEFQPNNLNIRRQSPSGLVFYDNLALNNLNGNYTLYMGGVSGHNGTEHIDFDNFVVTSSVPEPATIGIATGLASLILGAGLRKRRKREEANK